MKKISFLFAALCLFALATKAQDSTKAKVKEMGIGLYNLNSFSLQYRWGTKKTLYRVNAVLGFSQAFGKGSNTVTTNDSLPPYPALSNQKSDPLNFSVGVNFSILKFKPIIKNFNFMYGGIIGVSANYRSNTTTTTSAPYSGNSTLVQKNNAQGISPFIGAVVGVSYQVSSHFLVYLEIAPNIYYSYTNNSVTTTNTQLSNGFENTSTSKGHFNSFGLASFSNSGAMLTFVYRITK
ncbi:MAG: hypothetical protein JST67_05250 [Bacteroidetes bacterium]|nr:hypothetical protein [Bacteroidota bacterium]